MSITLPQSVLSKYVSATHKTFVETGTFEGGAVQLALNCGFSKVMSIELDTTLYLKCVERFSGDNRVELWLGDTHELLWKMIRDLEEPATFWLDAHAGNMAVGVEEAPLLTELEIIGKHSIKNHTIIIDDRRLMGVDFWGKVTEDKVIAALLAINPYYRIKFEDSNAAAQDIIVAVY